MGLPLLSWDLLNPDVPLQPSQWADKYRLLSPLSSAEPGRWRTSRTPYLKEPLDSFADPRVTDIVVQSSTQVGKTELILNILGYVIDYDPAPTMIVLPRDDDARGWAAKRVKPMVQTSPQLERHCTGKDDDLAGKFYRFDRMWTKFAGANSPADLASDPCRYVFFDEVNKYPKFSGREADPVKLGTERTRTYWNRKIVKVSTPTTTGGYITQEYDRSDKRRYYVPCPHCGVYQPLTFRREEGPARGQICWSEGATAEQVRRERCVWYECGFCQKAIEEFEKVRMVDRGVWCPEGCTVSAVGDVAGVPSVEHMRGYHLSALYSPWVTWSEIVAEFIEAKDRPSLLMNFVNSVLGEPWKERLAETSEAYLRKRIGVHSFGEVPAGVRALTAGVDVQKDHYYFTIRGWGLGEESWLVRYGRVDREEELLHALLFTQYQVHGGGNMQVRLVCIDSGARTNEVYALCIPHRHILRPIKGYDHILTAPMRTTILEKDSVGRPIQGGLALWSLDVNYFKDKLNRLIHTEPGTPGEWHMCADPSPDYIEQMLSEEKVIERNKQTGAITEKWQPKTENRANHYWDCEVYALAGADMLKVYLLRDHPSEMTTYQPRVNQSWASRDREPRERPRGGGWIGRR